MKKFDIDKEISKAHLEANGWQLESHRQGEPITSNVFYLIDFRVPSVRLFAVSISRFNELIKNPPPFKMSEIVDSVCSISYEMKKSKKNMKAMPLTLASYFINTGTFEKMRRTPGYHPENRIHVLAHIYGSRNNAYLRSAVMSCDKTIMDPNRLNETSKALMMMDLDKHPEWFPKE